MEQKKKNRMSGQISLFELLGLTEPKKEQYSLDEISAEIEALQKKAREQAARQKAQAAQEEKERLARERAERAERQRLAREQQRREEQERCQKARQVWLARLEELRRLEKERQEQREERERKRLEKQERLARKQREREEAHIREVTSMELPLDWENLFDTDERAKGVHAESIPDGLVRSLTTLGRVDIEYIASITGEDLKTVIGALRGSIYQNPDRWDECFYKGWETSDEYLSGNLKRKWTAAKAANERYKGFFSENLAAIERVLPPAVAAKDIYITLGSPWVPPDIIDDFITHLFIVRDQGWNLGNATRHDELTGTWEIPHKSRYAGSIRATQRYGTPRMSALHILEKTLNMKTVAVTDEIIVPVTDKKTGKIKRGTRRVLNKEETVAALEKQQLLIETFQKWVWKDEKRKDRLVTIFEERFGCVRRRVFDGSFLDLPTLSPEVRLYPYQKDAVARIIFSPNTLLAHEVGSGKTYEMIAAGQELRRMGLSKKNLYVVPNNIVGQWREIFLTMYPAAKLLCVEPKGFTPKNRDKVLARMQNEDLDGIIIAYSCFERIPLSKKYRLEVLGERLKTVAGRTRPYCKPMTALKRKEQALNKELLALNDEPDDPADSICFDQLGITRLFVDEAHNFKNVPLETKADKVLGIRSAGSGKCQDMMDKVRMVQRQNGGGGVVFATGTPITNSITDAYILQQYLQSGELALLELQSFDSWVGMFAEQTTEFEIDVDTSGYRLATRFAKFHNLPELTSLLASIADFHQVDEQAGIPRMDGYEDALIPKTPGFAAYLQEISRRADLVRQGLVPRTEDNMLKITSDGRKAALDLRLVEPETLFTWQSKVGVCAENVAEIYRRTGEDKSAQLVFCDISTPKEGFNLYDALKDLLVRLGLPAGEIVFIHDAATEAKRSRLFARVRSGEVRVLIGSTFKLGLGVNIQDRLIALHHLDLPWRPADMTQREGRILRQGNRNGRVFIHRYITEGSFDAYSWQLLETKQRFITDLLSGSMTERSGGDIDDTVLNYAEVKALAVGNPLVKQRVEAANELNRCLTLQRKWVDARLRMERELAGLPARLQNQREVIDKCERDLAFCAEQMAREQTQEQDAEERRRQREEVRAEIGRALKEHLLASEERPLLDYRGFAVVLPAGMVGQKLYLWLCREGRYCVELGSGESWSLVRLDHAIDHLNEHLDRMRQELDRLGTREAEITAELEKNEGYAERIEACRKRIEKLDKKLGVDQK